MQNIGVVIGVKMILSINIYFLNIALDSMSLKQALEILVLVQDTRSVIFTCLTCKLKQEINQTKL